MNKGRVRAAALTVNPSPQASQAERRPGWYNQKAAPASVSMIQNVVGVSVSRLASKNNCPRFRAGRRRGSPANPGFAAQVGWAAHLPADIEKQEGDCQSYRQLSQVEPLIRTEPGHQERVAGRARAIVAFPLW